MSPRPRMGEIGIIAALPGELKPLVREWPRTDQVHIGFLELGKGGAMRCLAAAEGMGTFAAARSFAALRAASPAITTLVSYGWAGALTNRVDAPGVYTVGEVVDARTGERFATAAEGAGPRLVTLDHVARRAEKPALAGKYGAALVDMEAATVGRLARAHGLGFLCLRGVSDGVDDDLPDFNRFLGRDGQLRMGRFVLHALGRPGSWGTLAEMGRNSRAAAEALAQALPRELAWARLVL